MGRLLVPLIICFGSLSAMEKKPSGSESLLDAIKHADIEAVRTRLADGEKPLSEVIHKGLEDEYHLNRFATEVMNITEENTRVAILQLLLDHGLSPDHSVQFGKEGTQKMPLLSYVIERFGTKKENCPADVALLIAYDAFLGERDYAGRPPLEHAHAVVNIEAAKMLRLSGAAPLEHGIDKPYKEEIRELLFIDIEAYKARHPEDCVIIVSRIEALREERRLRKKERDS